MERSAEEWREMESRGEEREERERIRGEEKRGRRGERRRRGQTGSKLLIAIIVLLGFLSQDYI